MSGSAEKPAGRKNLRWLIWVALALLVGGGLWQLGTWLWWGITGPAPQTRVPISLTSVFETVVAQAAAGELPSPRPPTPTLDPISAAYVEEAGAAFRAWSVARNRIGERGQALETNPEVVNDPVWRADFEEALTSLEKAAQGLRALPPPAPGYEAVAEAGPQLADLTDALVRDLRAMLAGDAAALEAAGKQLKQADAAHNAALRVLRGFQ